MAEALEPLCLGGERALGNFRPTLGFLPASALRGALVSSLAEALAAAGEPLAEETVERLFLDRRTALRFGDGWPCRIDDDDTQAAPPRAEPPSPFTLLTCKKGGREHGELDTLLRSYAVSLLAEQRQFVAPSWRCPHPLCGSRLLPASRQGAGTLRRVITRVGLDRERAKAADEQLFSLETLERGSRFVARLGGLDAASRILVDRALAHGLRIGHGRGQGYGRLVCSLRAAPANDLEARLAAFDAAAREFLAALGPRLGSSPLAAGLYFTATLASDLAPAGESSGEATAGAEETLLAALGLDGDTRVLAGEVRGGRRGGWDDRRGWHKPLRPVLLAGSALLLHSPLDLGELLPALERLERRGAGTATAEGLGWISFSSPAHHPAWRTP